MVAEKRMEDGAKGQRRGEGKGDTFGKGRSIHQNQSRAAQEIPPRKNNSETNINTIIGYMAHSTWLVKRGVKRYDRREKDAKPLKQAVGRKPPRSFDGIYLSFTRDITPL